MAWHHRDWTAICSDLGVTPESGLESSEARSRLALAGPNQIERAIRRPLWRRFLDQFSNFMILVLLAAAVVSGVIGEITDSVAIIVIVALNAIVGFIQEYRAEKALEALQALMVPTVRVRRDGEEHEWPAGDLVSGDIVLLEAGNLVPADLRLIRTMDLRLDEAALTGESVSVSKHTLPLDETDMVLGDRANMAFNGTLVSNGRGEGVVVAAGMNTELGRIARLLSEGEISGTPLQKRLEIFGRRLVVVVLVICVAIFLAGIARDEPVMLMLLTGVSLAVAAIPEALPAVVTVALALGAKRMVRHQALVRRLPAVETLGSVTCICSDKTGTLTLNRMRAERFQADGRELPGLPEQPEGPWKWLAEAMVLNNDALVAASGKRSGDPTEIALLEAALDGGYKKAPLDASCPRVAEWTFDPTRKRMTTAHREGGRHFTVTKGAPEAVVPLCVDQLFMDGPGDFDALAASGAARELAGRGYRVLAFAMRTRDGSPQGMSPEAVERDLCFLGLVALLDPPRPEAKQAIADCRTAGITPVMITGDHPATALAIARRLGIADGTAKVLTGRDLQEMDEPRLRDAARDVRVYARVTPEHKIRIVEALQSNGEFAAMTGDGVNDAPALKRADIGVAMGEKGTDVAREAADMVLLDDNFATIVRAVREGRRIFDNIRKFIKYTMTSNAGEIWTLFLAPFLGLPLPLLPIQILWINLVTDGLPGLALSVEKAERGVMQRPPRPPDESVFAHGMWQHMVWVGLLIGGVSLGAQAWAWGRGSENWQTVVFTVLTLSQLVHALVIRSERDSLFEIGFAGNPALLVAVVLTLGLQMAAIYVPFLQGMLHTSALTLEELGVCLTLPWLVLVAVEMEKWAVRRGWLYAGRTGLPGTPA